MYKLITFYAIILFLAAAFLDARIKLYKEKRRRREAELNLAEMDLLAGDIRNFRHQYNNLFQTIICYIENEQWDLIKELKKEILQKTSSLNRNNRLQLLKIKNCKIRSIIFKMVEICDKSQITLTVMLSGEVNQVNMDEAALCNILMFFWDNILEEVKKSSKKEIVIKASSDGQSVSFVFDSSFADAPKVVRIYTEDFVHNHSDWKTRVNAIEKILDKNGNLIFNNYLENDYYRQEVMIM